MIVVLSQIAETANILGSSFGMRPFGCLWYVEGEDEQTDIQAGAGVWLCADSSEPFSYQAP